MHPVGQMPIIPLSGRNRVCQYGNEPRRSQSLRIVVVVTMVMVRVSGSISNRFP